MSTAIAPPPTAGGTKRERLENAVIRFCGDSGDGMQVTGSQFTNTAALFGNDLSTFPDFPAEIRAPQGTLPGVSGFQVNFSSTEVFTPGDSVDVLIAMNPAALKTNLADLKTGGILIVNSDSFSEVDFKKAKITSNPLEDGSLAGYRVFAVDLLKLTKAATKDTGLDAKSVDRSKNFFALGMCYWLFGRSLDGTLRWIDSKFKGQVAEANKLTLRAGYAYCEATEAYQTAAYEVAPAKLAPGTYRNLSGNNALAMGLVAGSERSGLPLFLGSYPITPASDILHELAMYKSFGVVTFQAEDEIAAVTSAIGAAYGGCLATTTTSGPGMALKMEAIGLAIAVELPLVVVDIQRGGPSTGLPTKTEQADLFQAIFGRNSEAPLPVLAPATPGDCFWVALEACRIAVKYMTPVIVLSDGYLANGAEPWKVPSPADLPAFPTTFRTDPEGFKPFLRNPETLARPWAVPGTAGLEHRIGGLEKQDVTGNINYEPENHDKMVRLRAKKVAGVVQDVPDVVAAGDAEGDVCIVGWGSTYGSITAALHSLRAKGHKVGHVHLRHLNPLPKNLAAVMKRYKKVLVPEMNLGQLAFILRGLFLVDAISYSKVEGKPFKQSEIEKKVLEVIK
jgi:2-oxoglutarate ferredoxin oxidoreductase subunit alpha